MTQLGDQIRESLIAGIILPELQQSTSVIYANYLHGTSGYQRPDDLSMRPNLLQFSIARPKKPKNAGRYRKISLELEMLTVPHTSNHRELGNYDHWE